MQVTNANARLVRSTRALFAQKTRSPPHAHAPNRLGPHQRQRPLLTRIDVPRTHANRIAHARPLAHIGTARFHASTPANMSDAEYEAFLNKASGGQATTTTTTTQQEQKYGTKSVNTAVPRELESVQETYTSDADEPFEAVALEFEGEGEGLGAGQLKKLLGHDAEVEELSVDKWDPRGQYKKVVDIVKKVVDGEVKVFRVELSGVRQEYYVVGVKDSKVVGLKALSVES